MNILLVSNLSTFSKDLDFENYFMFFPKSYIVSHFKNHYKAEIWRKGLFCFHFCWFLSDRYPVAPAAIWGKIIFPVVTAFGSMSRNN